MPRGSKETGKLRSGRIPLDYFQRADGLRRLKRGLTLLACVVSVGWLILASVRGVPPNLSASRLGLLANHGPLVQPHASFEHQCDQCHEPFTPIDGSGWVARSVGSDHASDQKCQNCHRDVPAHYALEEAPPSCASCHRDHRGRDVSLVAISDAQCSSCHASFKALTRSDGSKTKSLKNVVRFDNHTESHPEFALFRQGNPTDPGQIAFNHALHMRPGLPNTPNGVPLKRIGELPEEARQFYQKDPLANPDLTEPVQLRCDSCHRLNSELAKSKNAAGGSSRRGIVDLMAPINYDQHCKACHPNSYGDGNTPAIRHGLTPSEVRNELWNVYSSQFVQNNPHLRSIRRIEQPIPGRSVEVEIREAQTVVTRQVEKAESCLFGGGRCGECHKFQSADGKPLDEKAVLADPASSRVAPAAITTRWLPGARFDHSAHPHKSDADCLGCHKKDSMEEGVGSTQNTDVLIPRSENCRTCHGPAVEVAVGEKPKAGNNCTECHNYHSDNEGIPTKAGGSAPLRQVDGEILRWIRDELPAVAARRP